MINSPLDEAYPTGNLGCFILPQYRAGIANGYKWTRGEPPPAGVSSSGVDFLKNLFGAKFNNIASAYNSNKFIRIIHNRNEVLNFD